MFEVSTDPTTMSPVALFLQADLVVKSVMILLLAASVWTWTIIVSASMRISAAAKESDEFERSFLQAEDVETFSRQHRDSDVPSARVFMAGLAEWRQSTKGKIDREGTRARLSSALAAGVAAEIDRLADRLNVLATVGSVAPFVGLFGTVWGIMRSFSGIAAAQNTSLAVVAPGIAEALFATALGLFAAIPAVIAYNRLSHRLNRLEARLGRFADGFHATLSRELDAL
ncbi:MAG: protein TolQ [Pseudomonadota bacterium]